MAISRNSKEGRSFAVISLTDHNTTEEISEALFAGERYGKEVIPGIGIDTSYKGQTFSGEHSIGSKSNKYISMALEPVQIEIMKKIKKALDPNLILNPRKIF